MFLCFGGKYQTAKTMDSNLLSPCELLPMITEENCLVNLDYNMVSSDCDDIFSNYIFDTNESKQSFDANDNNTVSYIPDGIMNLFDIPKSINEKCGNTQLTDNLKSNVTAERFQSLDFRENASAYHPKKRNKYSYDRQTGYRKPYITECNKSSSDSGKFSSLATTSDSNSYIEKAHVYIQYKSKHPDLTFLSFTNN